MTNTAIISPFYDIEYNDEPPRTFQFGDRKFELAVRGRCLIVGGPGRGKTATAILMGLLAGYSQIEIKRAIQHGQPQMTIADLFGHPLPADMVKADNIGDIRISWRKWLSMRVKIIDEYNRIPTRTQSALLTVLADNYAEILDHWIAVDIVAIYIYAVKGLHLTAGPYTALLICGFSRRSVNRQDNAGRISGSKVFDRLDARIRPGILGQQSG